MQMVGETYRFDTGWLKVRFAFDSPSQGSFVANATVYSNVTVDGTLYNLVGTITEVTDRCPTVWRRCAPRCPARPGRILLGTAAHRGPG
jgi:hypothetical protein